MNVDPTTLSLIAVGAACAALGVWAGWAWLPPRKQLPPLPDVWALAERPVFSSSERRVYNQLRLAFPKYIVVPKLPLVRLCQPSTPDRAGHWYQLIGAIHVSFAVCNANGHVLLVIDLDNGRTHSRRSTQIKEAVLEACGIERVHCTAEALPTQSELRTLMGDGISSGGMGTGTGTGKVSSSDGGAMASLPSLPTQFVAEQHPYAEESATAAAAARERVAGDTPISAPITTPTPTLTPAPHATRSAAPPAPSPETWHDASVFLDSFFTGDDRPDVSRALRSPPQELPAAAPAHSAWPDLDGGVVADDRDDAPMPHAGERRIARRR